MSPRKRKFHGGRWQQQRERCRIDSNEPPAPECKIDCMSSVLSDILKKAGTGQLPIAKRIEHEWSKLVGETVAAHTRPSQLRNNGSLVVFVDSSMWYSELSRYGKQKMLINIQKQLKSTQIQAIELRLDPDGSRRPGRRQ